MIKPISVLMIFVAFFIAFIITGPVIRFLRSLKASQTEREELVSHKKKEGTPTMGGLIFIISICITFFCFYKYTRGGIAVLIFSLGYGLIGFLDDYLKVVLKRSDGLIARQKFMLQIAICVFFVIYLYKFSGIELTYLIPFTDIYFDFGILTIPFLFITIIGTANGVNFTDGLDGLSTSVTLAVAAFLVVASAIFNPSFIYMPIILMGALFAFLTANVHPAKVFMGDTGSLFLGGFVASMSVCLRLPIFIIIFGFVYLMEVISVIMQVGYFKATKGKRIFRMAPIHHHFELGGWSETRVVYNFTLVTILLSLIAFLGM